MHASLVGTQLVEGLTTTTTSYADQVSEHSGKIPVDTEKVFKVI